MDSDAIGIYHAAFKKDFILVIKLWFVRAYIPDFLILEIVRLKLTDVKESTGLLVKMEA